MKNMYKKHCDIFVKSAKAGNGRWPTIKAGSSFGACLALPCKCDELSAALDALQEVSV